MKTSKSEDRPPRLRLRCPLSRLRSPSSRVAAWLGLGLAGELACKKKQKTGTAGTAQAQGTPWYLQCWRPGLALQSLPKCLRTEVERWEI